MSVGHDLRSQTRRFVGIGVEQHDVGDVNAGLLLGNAALAVFGGRLGVPLHNAYFLDQHPFLLVKNPKDPPDLALILAGQNDDLIIFPNMTKSFRP